MNLASAGYKCMCLLFYSPYFTEYTSKSLTWQLSSVHTFCTDLVCAPLWPLSVSLLLFNGGLHYRSSLKPSLIDWEVNATQRTQGEHAVTVQSQADTNVPAMDDTAGEQGSYYFHGQDTHFT